MKAPFFKIKVGKKKIVIFLVGRAKSGKSFLGRFIAEIAGLAENPCALLIDSDEQADRDFFRWNSERVHIMPLKHREDLAKLTGAMPPNCSLVFADLAGARQGFMEIICGDSELLNNHGIEIVPIIVTSEIEEVTELTLRWLEIFKESKKAFLIVNQHQYSPNIVPFTQLPAGKPRPADVAIMSVPPLDVNVANEIARVACSIGDVVEGEISTKVSETLALGLYQTATAVWANEAISNLEPLFTYIGSVVVEENPPLGAQEAQLPKQPASKKATA